LKIDELVKSKKSKLRWQSKKLQVSIQVELAKSRLAGARKSRVMRRTYRTPQSQRDEAQRRNWTFYEAIKIGFW